MREMWNTSRKKKTAKAKKKDERAKASHILSEPLLPVFPSRNGCSDRMDLIQEEEQQHLFRCV
jgi:hypothetical protein